MKLARRQRRFWFGIGYTVAGLLVIGMVWLSHSTSWTSTGSGANRNVGTSILRLGMLPYVEIERVDVDVHLRPISNDASISMTISWPNLILNLLATILISLLYFYGFTRLVRNKRLPHGLCDECGYDLRESRDCCPECGARIAAFPAARSMRGSKSAIGAQRRSWRRGSRCL